jgi:hypothetical protein
MSWGRRELNARAFGLPCGEEEVAIPQINLLS